MVNYKKFKKDNKKKKLSIEFDMRIKNFTFSNESCFPGANFHLPNSFKKMNFHHNLHIKIMKERISPNERIISFEFLLEMKPDLGEIGFDGECILESPQQEKIELLLEKIPQSMINNPVIMKHITLQCYVHSSKIAKKNNISFPPPALILPQLGLKKR